MTDELFPTPEPMTKAERLELVKLLDLRAKVAKADIDARKALLVADAEERLAAEFDSDDARWAAAVNVAKEAVDNANRTIATAAAEMGLPENFAPQVHIGWSRRGENVDPKRRAELRKVAATRIEAQAKLAKVEVDRAQVHARAELAGASFTTDEGRQWLERIPTPEALMPPLTVDQIKALAPGRAVGYVYTEDR